MLGLKKSKSGRTIFAHGKHPAFDDFFSINMEDSPLATALSTWIEKGLEQGRTSIKKPPCFFRFWIKGLKKEELVLGIVRDSSDSLGRAYPLIVLFNTRMSDRDRQWHKIFNDFETVFRNLEDVVAARYEAFQDFEAALLRIKPVRPDMDTPDTSGLPARIMAWFTQENHRDNMTLPITELETKYAQHVKEEDKWGFFKKKACLPSAVFLGGLTDHPGAAFFNRPLKARDFIDLFQMAAPASQEDQYQ